MPAGDSAPSGWPQGQTPIREKRIRALVLPEPSAWVFAVLTGASVVLVTLLADRLGGAAGGLLATAPVTTSAAHVVIATSVPATQAASRVLDGGYALLAATVALVVFFYAVKLTRGRDSNVRLAVGVLTYLATFLPLTLAIATLNPPPIVTFPLLFVAHAVLAFTFVRQPVPVLEGYVPERLRRTPLELATRVGVGGGVVLLIHALVHAAPALAGALAVVPAVFIVSLTVMGVAQNAPFAARAAQAGLFGTTAVAIFVLVVAAYLGTGLPFGVWGALPFAWVAYGGTLAALGRLHRRIAR